MLISEGGSVNDPPMSRVRIIIIVVLQLEQIRVNLLNRGSGLNYDCVFLSEGEEERRRSRYQVQGSRFKE